MEVANMNREQRINLLVKLVENAQQKGAYLLRESNLLKKARDYFNPEVEEKPTFTEDDKDPELIAQDLLMQAVEVGNRKGAYSLDEAAMAYELVENLRQEIIKSRQSQGSAASTTASTTAASGSSSSSSSSANRPSNRRRQRVESEEEQDDADEEIEAPAFRNLGKGKGRAA